MPLRRGRGTSATSSSVSSITGSFMGQRIPQAHERKRPPTGQPAPIRHGPRATPDDQLRVLSTSLLALIQGIMSRSLAPTTSIWCSSVRRRREIRVGAPALVSRVKDLEYSPLFEIE